MTKKHTTFLTRNQVINAVRIDYEQYGFQLPLMQKLFPLITGNRIVISEDGRNSYLLIKRGKKSKTIRMNEAELIDYMINLLSESEIFIHRMADVCTLVFETHAEPENDPETGERGVRIETGMDRFECRNCSHCCRNMIYDNGCSSDDYQRWKDLGRTDILNRVMVLYSENLIIGYRIWMDPDSRRILERCPWLKPDADGSGYLCSIHDAKPDVCRQYPYTPKHALITGCRGLFRMDGKS